MDRETVVTRFRQEIQGVWLDVVLKFNKDPEKLGFWLETAQNRTSELAGKLFDVLTKEKPNDRVEAAGAGPRIANNGQDRPAIKRA